MNNPGSRVLLSYAERGLSYSQVAEMLGFKTNTVEYWVRSYGMNKEYQEVKKRALASTPNPILPCEGCGTSEHDGSYGSGRFCGERCARGFATKNMSEEANARRLEGLQLAHQIRLNRWEEWRKAVEDGEEVEKPYFTPTVTWTEGMRQSLREQSIIRWQDSIYRAKQLENKSERCKAALTPEVREKSPSLLSRLWMRVDCLPGSHAVSTCDLTQSKYGVRCLMNTV